MLNFTVQMPGGETETLSSKELLQQYSQYNPQFQAVGITNDGASGIYNTPTGMQTIPFHEMLAQKGMNITEFSPENAVPAENLMKYRTALESISDPDVRDAYIKTVAAKDYGIQGEPMVVGQANSKYLWNPNEQQWIALTDKPGLDAGDIAGGAIGLGRGAAGLLGSIGGGVVAGAAGLPAGPAAVATGALGAGVGGAAATAGYEALLGAGLTALDPNLRSALGEKSGAKDPNYLNALGQYFRSEGKNIATNTAIGGAAGAAGPVIGRILQTPARAVTGMGGTIRGIGQTAEAAGAALRTPLGRTGLQMGLDPTGISGVGAMGGFAADVAQPIAQGAAKGLDAARNIYHSMRGTVGPLQPIAGETFQQTAQNLPNLGRFVRGVENLGGGLARMGTAAENVGTGALIYGGKGTAALGSGLRAAGQLGEQATLPSLAVAGQTTIRGLDPAYNAAMAGVKNNPAQGYRNLRELGIQQGYNAPQQPVGDGSLASAVAAAGGLANLLSR